MEVVRMPGCARFSMGVRFDKLYTALPVVRRSKAGSWTQRIPAMGFRLESTYCSHKNNINQEIAKHAPHPNKAFFVCAIEAQRKFPEFSEELTRGINSIGGGQFETPNEGSSTPEVATIHSPVNAVSLSQVDEVNDILSTIDLTDGERFVGADRQPIEIRLYGDRTKDKVRFDLLDMYAAFRSSQCNAEAAIVDAVTARIRCHSGEVMERNVVNMRHFVRLIGHFDRHGNENANLVFDWVIGVVFTAQYGDGVLVRQADHAAGVGQTLPSEFGKDLCGSYAYSFLEGSAVAIEEFPCLAEKAAKLGIADEPWSL